jgi:hypothetical protein
MQVASHFGLKHPLPGAYQLNHKSNLIRGLKVAILPGYTQNGDELVELISQLSVTTALSNGRFSPDHDLGLTFQQQGNNTFFSIPLDYSAIAAPIFSMNLWFRQTAQTNLTGLWSWGNTPETGNPFALIQQQSATLRFHVDNGYRETSQTLTINRLYNIGLSRGEDDVWSFYLNGKQISQYTDDGTPANIGNAQTVYTGVGFANSYYNKLGYSLLWDRELSPAEFHQLYNPATRWDLYTPYFPKIFPPPPAAAQQITLDTLNITSISIPIAFVPGEVTIPLDTLSVNISGIDLSITIGAISILLDSLSLSSNTPGVSITPDAISISVNTLNLLGSANDILVQLGDTTITLSELILLANAQTITISTEGRRYGPALQ